MDLTLPLEQELIFPKEYIKYSWVAINNGYMYRIFLEQCLAINLGRSVIDSITVYIPEDVDIKPEDKEYLSYEYTPSLLGRKDELFRIYVHYDVQDTISHLELFFWKALREIKRARRYRFLPTDFNIALRNSIIPTKLQAMRHLFGKRK